MGKPRICKKSMPYFLNRQNDQGTCFRIFQRARLMTFYKDAFSIILVKTLHHYPAKPQAYSKMALDRKAECEDHVTAKHCTVREDSTE